jgi:hypothetical protein
MLYFNRVLIKQGLELLIVNRLIIKYLLKLNAQPLTKTIYLLLKKLQNAIPL